MQGEPEQEDGNNVDHGLVNRRRKKGMRLLRRLAPGRNGSVGAVVDDRGVFQTDPQRMAGLLRDHWTKVFQARGIQQDKLDKCL